MTASPKGTFVPISRGVRLDAMHLAALRGVTKAIEMMIKLGADVNGTDDQGKTPLHDA